MPQLKRVVVGLLQKDGALWTGVRADGRWLAGKKEFPQGAQERGEHPADALPRELREELGITVIDRGSIGVVRIDARHNHPAVLMDVRVVQTVDGRDPTVDPSVHRTGGFGLHALDWDNTWGPDYAPVLALAREYLRVLGTVAQVAWAHRPLPGGALGAEPAARTLADAAVTVRRPAGCPPATMPTWTVPTSTAAPVALPRPPRARAARARAAAAARG